MGQACSFLRGPGKVAFRRVRREAIGTLPASGATTARGSTWEGTPELLLGRPDEGTLYHVPMDVGFTLLNPPINLGK